MKSKRGAGEFGVGVSIFIFIMALLMVIYLLLIPPEERNKVLEDRNVLSADCENDCQISLDRCRDDCDTFDCKIRCNDDFRNCRDGCIRSGNVIGGNLLLSESPGIVRPIQNFKFSADLNPISLFSQVKRVNVALPKSLYVESWLFGGDAKSLNFNSPKDVKKISLVFFPGEKNGILEIRLNENIIYSGNAEANDLPIDLPISLLKENNKLSFSAKSKWLSKSYFKLIDLSLAMELFQENLISNRKFVLTKDEVVDIKRAFVSYFISCSNINTRQGSLRIDFNGKTLYDDIVFCDAGRPSLDISSSLIREGENKIDFVLNPSGDNGYDITDLKFNADMRNFDFPKYRFDIGRRQFEDVASGRADLLLHVLSVNDGLRKEASVNVNGAELYFNTNNAFITLDLSEYMVVGSNFIKIVPREAFEIERLDIVIE